MKWLIMALALVSLTAAANDGEKFDSKAMEFAGSAFEKTEHFKYTSSGTFYGILFFNDGTKAKPCFLEKEGYFYCMKYRDFIEMRGQ